MLCTVSYSHNVSGQDPLTIVVKEEGMIMLYLSELISNLAQRMFQVLSVMLGVNCWYSYYHCSSEQQPLEVVGKTEFETEITLQILERQIHF